MTGFSDDLKKNAKGMVKAVLEVLGVAASMTQNVPYLGIISSVLTEFLKIQDVRRTLLVFVPLIDSPSGG